MCCNAHKSAQTKGFKALCCVLGEGVSFLNEMFAILEKLSTYWNTFCIWIFKMDEILIVKLVSTLNHTTISGTEWSELSYMFVCSLSADQKQNSCVPVGLWRPLWWGEASRRTDCCSCFRLRVWTLKELRSFLFFLGKLPFWSNEPEPLKKYGILKWLWGHFIRTEHVFANYF